MSHTPGPWGVEVYRGGLVVSNPAPGIEQIVCTVMSAWELFRDASHDTQIDTLEANAHLIAASPALLAACEQMLEEMLCQRSGEGAYRETLTLARAAIESARPK